VRGKSQGSSKCRVAGEKTPFGRIGVTVGLALLVLLLGHPTSAATAPRFRFAPTTSQASIPPVVSYGEGGVTLRFELPDPQIERVREGDGNAYVAVNLPGYGSPADPGFPELPVIDVQVETPRLEPLPRVRLAECVWREVRLEAPVRPAQDPVPKIPGALEAMPFRLEAEAYQGPGFRNAWREKLGTWYRLTPVRKAGSSFLRLELFLVTFDASRLLLKYPTRFTVELSWRDGPTAVRPTVYPRRGPIQILSVPLRNPEDLRTLAAGGYDVANRTDDTVVVYATSTEASALREAGFEPTVLPNDAPKMAQQLRDRRRKSDKDRTLGIYHSFAELTAFLTDLAAEHPTRCLVQSIGSSRLGREIWAVKISDNVGTDEDEEPEVRLAATMHGDEPPGTEMCLYFMDYILTEYERDDRARRLVDGLELWFVPLLNPDGLTTYPMDP